MPLLKRSTLKNVSSYCDLYNYTVIRFLEHITNAMKKLGVTEWKIVVFLSTIFKCVIKTFQSLPLGIRRQNVISMHSLLFPTLKNSLSKAPSFGDIYKFYVSPFPWNSNIYSRFRFSSRMRCFLQVSIQSSFNMKPNTKRNPRQLPNISHKSEKL